MSRAAELVSPQRHARALFARLAGLAGLTLLLAALIYALAADALLPPQVGQAPLLTRVRIELGAYARRQGPGVLAAASSTTGGRELGVPVPF